MSSSDVLDAVAQITDRPLVDGLDDQPPIGRVSSLITLYCGHPAEVVS